MSTDRPILDVDLAHRTDALGVALRQQVQALPRLTRLVTRFLALIAARDASATSIATGLRAEPALVGWILRQANSGFFNLSRPVTTLSDALVVIGIAPITRMVFAACTHDLLRPQLRRYPCGGSAFWLHAFAVGTLARALVAHLGSSCGLVPDEALLAGLLHDIGKRALDPLLENRGGPNPVTLAEERAVAGCDHGIVSAAICMQWELPSLVVHVVATHHDEVPDGRAALVALADAIAHHEGFGDRHRASATPALPAGAWASLRGELDLPATDLERLLAATRPVLAGLSEMLRLLGHNPLPLDRSAAQPIEADTPAPAPVRHGRRDRGRDRHRPPRTSRRRR